MARGYYLMTNVLLLLTTFSFNIAARSMNVLNSVHYIDDHAISGTTDLFSLAAMKSGGGPSGGGEGHQFPTANSFGDIKNSGNKGYQFTNDKSLGEIKNSGPSPGGKGHGFPDAQTFGNIKNSGPSPGGKGH